MYKDGGGSRCVGVMFEDVWPEGSRAAEIKGENTQKSELLSPSRPFMYTD